MYLMDYVRAKMIATWTPQFLIRNRTFRKLKMKFFPGYDKMCRVLYAEFEPYIFRHIKQERFFEYPNNNKKNLK